MDIPRITHPHFRPYTTEDAINDACDSLISLINVRRQELLELLKERRQKIENLKKCKGRAQLEFPQVEALFIVSVTNRWYYPRLPKEKQSQLCKHLYQKEREAYGSWKSSVVCDKKAFRESLKKLIDVVLEVTNPEDMKYQPTTTTYECKVLTAGSVGINEGEYYGPQAIAYDDTTQELFIADSWNGRIVVCSSTGIYLQQFGNGILDQPYGLVLAPHCLYTTDYGAVALFKFTRPEFKLMCRTGEYGGKERQFNKPRQLATNNGWLYVCDSGNDRVPVYSTGLNYQYSIKDKAMKYPKDIKFNNNNEMFVLCYDNLVVFNISKPKSVRTLVYNQLYHASFFCFDRYWNILVTDWTSHNIRVYSPTGDLLNSVRKKGHDVGDLCYPTGICFTNTYNINCIICVSCNRNYTIQMFY